MAEDPRIHAQQLVAQFKARGGAASRDGCQKGNIWLNVCRNKVADGLQNRIMNPNIIAQTSTNMCGIAAFVHEWAQDDPVGYAWLGISLYEAGWGRIGKGSMLGKEVRPSSDLKTSPIPYYHSNGHTFEMNHADWVVLASIREAFNGLFTRYTATDPFEPLAGMTTPGEVVNAFKAAGYTSIINQADWAMGKGFDNIQEASDLVDAKWKVVLLINDRMLYDDKMDTEALLIRTANHWVGLLSPIRMTLVGKDYSISPFQVFTWGSTRWVPTKKTNFPLTTLLKNYYGYVAAKY